MAKVGNKKTLRTKIGKGKVDVSEIEGAVKKSFTGKIDPMLATRILKPFDSEDWLTEIKLDGYRAIAEVSEGTARIYSRNLNDFKHFSEVEEALRELPYDAIFDGEIIVTDEDGNHDFYMLRDYQYRRQGYLSYQIFDLLYYQGYDLTNVPLYKRKEILKEIFPDHPRLRFVNSVSGNAVSVFEGVKNSHLEGIVLKKADSKYRLGERSTDWLKIPKENLVDAVVIGYTLPNRTRLFGALVLGVYEGKELKYYGHAINVPENKEKNRIYELLKRLEIDNPPLKEVPRSVIERGVQWLKPELVCEVNYSQIMRSGKLRRANFRRLRDDINPADVQRVKINNDEMPGDFGPGNQFPETVPSYETKVADRPAVKRKSKETAEKLKGKKKKTVPAAETLQEKNNNSGSHHNTIDEGTDEHHYKLKHPLVLHSLDKVVFPDLHLKKSDILEYYYNIASWILPYLRQRPQFFRWHPGTIRESRYNKSIESLQEDWKGNIPEWVQTEKIFAVTYNEERTYMMCPDKEHLLFLIDIGCVELSPWHSKIKSIDYPDYVIIDLDPVEIDFAYVVEVAQVAKEVLDSLDIPSHVKTSGSKGLHIYIPLDAKTDYDISRNLCEYLCRLIHKQTSELTSMLRMPNQRKGKVYLDFLQNSKGKSIASPYSIRPNGFAGVATPLFWEEVKPGLKISDFTYQTIFDRLNVKGDPFKDLLKKKINAERTLMKLKEFSDID